MKKAAVKPKSKFKITKTQAKQLAKKDSPFFAVDSEPGVFWDKKDGTPVKPVSKYKLTVGVNRHSKRNSHRSKPKKVLTNQKQKRIIGLVNKLKRKDDKMANDKQKTNKIKGTGKAAIWGIFAIHQGFVAWLVITNFDNYVAVTAAITGFGLAVISVGMVGAILSKSYSK